MIYFWKLTIYYLYMQKYIVKYSVKREYSVIIKSITSEPYPKHSIHGPYLSIYDLYGPSWVRQFQQDCNIGMKSGVRMYYQSQCSKQLHKVQK